MMADALLLVAAISACVVYLVMVVLARRRERELADARAHEQRLKSLTELSADWFWETDAGHRITWLSGGGPVATLFGDTPTYGKRFWEIPRVEVDARALETHLERLGKQLPFFDLEIARDGKCEITGITEAIAVNRQCPIQLGFVEQLHGERPRAHVMLRKRDL